MNHDITELRSGDRYVPMQPIRASFGAADATILNLAENGAQLEHPQPLRLASRARLVCRFQGNTIAVGGIVIWSHLSKTPNGEGKYLYRSGVRFDSDLDLQPLAGRGILRRDPDSLERKRQRMAERERVRAQQPVVKFITPAEIPADHVLLIQHARERLRTHPDEAMKWYNRAKFALVDEDSPVILDATVHHREDILAVWEYLERSIDLSTVVKVFERKG